MDHIVSMLNVHCVQISLSKVKNTVHNFHSAAERKREREREREREGREREGREGGEREEVGGEREA